MLDPHCGHRGLEPTSPSGDDLLVDSALLPNMLSFGVSPAIPSHSILGFYSLLLSLLQTFSPHDPHRKPQESSKSVTCQYGRSLTQQTTQVSIPKSVVNRVSSLALEAKSSRELVLDEWTSCTTLAGVCACFFTLQIKRIFRKEAVFFNFTFRFWRLRTSATCPTCPLVQKTATVLLCYAQVFQRQTRKPYHLAP